MNISMKCRKFLVIIITLFSFELYALFEAHLNFAGEGCVRLTNFAGLSPQQPGK